MTLFKVFFKYFGILMLIGLSLSDLKACICPTPTFEQEVRYSDEIFLGKIVKVERYEVGRSKKWHGHERVYWGWRFYFEVERKWKGNTQSEFIIQTNGSSCALLFDIYPEKILVYASRASEIKILYEDDNKLNEGIEVLHASVCSRITSKYQVGKEENWYEDDLRKLDNKFRIQVKLGDIQENREAVYENYSIINKLIPFVGGFIIFLIALNVFQFFRNRKIIIT